MVRVKKKGGAAAFYYFPIGFSTFLRAGILAYEAMLEQFGFI